ncbi:MAG: zinc-dependent alcohol dehydrogenase family protein, partial [bacterium]
MKAMVVEKPGPVEKNPLKLQELLTPEPASGEILIRIEVCGVCRTDLHVAEGELPPHKSSVVPGHEVIGQVEKLGEGASHFRIGDRVGVAWLHQSCGNCSFCQRNQENLCDAPKFTGYDVNGGYAEYLVAPEAFVYSIPLEVEASEAAPFLCAGIIGYRALKRSDVQKGQRLALYGFGGSAHIVIQIAHYWGCEVYVISHNKQHHKLAYEMGASWVGLADEKPPKKFHSAIVFAPVGHLVLPALENVEKGGTVALAGIYMSPIPEMDYMKYIFEERNLRSVTASTRQDGKELLKLAGEIPLHTHTQEYPLEEANESLKMLKHGQING